MARCSDMDERKHLKPTPTHIPTSALPPETKDGEEKVLLFTTLSFIFILTTIAHIFHQHISPPTLPGWTTIHCSPKPTVQNNPDFWSDIQTSQNMANPHWRSVDHHTAARLANSFDIMVKTSERFYADTSTYCTGLFTPRSRKTLATSSLWHLQVFTVATG